MILARTRSALRRRGAATLSQLSADLAVSRSQADAALCYWMHRGAVQSELYSACASTACGGCAIAARCAAPAPAAEAVRIYRWVQ